MPRHPPIRFHLFRAIPALHCLQSHIFMKEFLCHFHHPIRSFLFYLPPPPSRH